MRKQAESFLTYQLRVCHARLTDDLEAYRKYPFYGDPCTLFESLELSFGASQAELAQALMTPTTNMLDMASTSFNVPSQNCTANRDAL